jgi:Tfp pilus assembly protein PilN
VKAVNLIPADERRGGSGTPGRSGGAVYAVLGVLGVLLIALGAYAVLSRQVADRETELAEIQAQSAEISAQVEVLRPFGEFAELRTQRVSALRTLAGARVDWSRVLEDLSVALPSDARLSSLTASVTPVEGAAAAPAPGGEAAAPAESGPSLQLAGCTTDDRAVADLLVRLRQMSGVRGVDLASAIEDEQSTTQGAPADCDTAFNVTVSFAALPGAAAAGVPAATPPAAAEADADGEQSDDDDSADGEATPAAPSGDEGDDQ